MHIRTTKWIIAFICFSLLLVSCSKKPDAIDSQGQHIFFKNFEGKWLVLNYWAEWCKPCHQEIPAFNAFYEKHKDKVIVLGINFDNIPPEAINKFKAQLQITYPLLTTNPGPQFGITEIAQLPATFLISPDRKTIIPLFGEQTENNLLTAMKG